MSEKLKEPQIVDSMPASTRGGRANYKWDEWLDGKIRTFIQGEQFLCTPDTFRMAARNAAQVREIEVIVRVQGKKVWVQAQKRRAAPDPKPADMPRKPEKKKG